LENHIKEQLTREINRMIYHKRAEDITAVQEVYDKEIKKSRNKEKNKDDGGLTSSHHMAAEVVVRKMKQCVKRKHRNEWKKNLILENCKKYLKNATMNELNKASNMFSMKRTESIFEEEIKKSNIRVYGSGNHSRFEYNTNS
jgi:hypothetical protein